jgi:hypothetical protein
VGPVPALIEWDTDLPALEVLLEEAREAERIAVDVAPPAAVAAAQPAPSEAAAPAPPSDTEALAALQETFGAALLDPGQARLLAPALKGDAGRLDIYRGNLVSAWRRALASAYPVLRRLLGEACFGSLSRAYGRAHPAREPDLNRYGAVLAEFIGGIDARPWLPELGRLEWSAHEAWYAPDAPDSEARAVLATLSPQQFEDSRAILHPSLRLHASGWNTAAFWLAQQGGADALPAEPVQTRGYALVLRARWQVSVRELSAAEHAALLRLANGESFGAAFDAAFDLDEDAPIAAWLDGWLKEGVLQEIVKEVGPPSA